MQGDNRTLKPAPLMGSAGPLLLTADEAAVYTGLTLARLRKLTRSGDIPHRKLGGRYFYPTASLEAWVEGLVSDES